MTQLEHNDRIFATKRKEWLLVCEPFVSYGVQLRVGDRLRVESPIGRSIKCLTESGREVCLFEDTVPHVEREHRAALAERNEQ